MVFEGGDGGGYNSCVMLLWYCRRPSPSASPSSSSSPCQAMSLGVGALIFDVDVVRWRSDERREARRGGRTEARIRSVWPSLCFPPLSLLHRARRTHVSRYTCGKILAGDIRLTFCFHVAMAGDLMTRLTFLTRGTKMAGDLMTRLTLLTPGELQTPVHHKPRCHRSRHCRPSHQRPNESAQDKSNDG